MGRKGSWFSSVRKVLSPHSKKDQKKQKSNEVGYGKHNDMEAAVPNEEAPFAVPPALPTVQDIKLTEAENKQSKYAYSVALATAVAAEAAVAAAQAAAEVVRLTSVPRYHGKSKEEIAATKIQTAFRGYLARRALRALKGLVRLKRLIQGQSVKRQAASTLRCMQTLTRLQSQVLERRARMSEENQALQWQLQQKHEKELEKLQAAQTVEEWDDSVRSKEQIEARLSKRQEAAIRRERALAYAFSHQKKWKNSSKSVNPTTFMDPNNPHWGWSWLDPWVLSQSCYSEGAVDHSDHASVQSMVSQPRSVGEITKLYTLRSHNNHNNKPSPGGQKSSRPLNHRFSSTPASKTPSISYASSKLRAPSPKRSSWGHDDDLRTTFSVQSERYRRHTISGSSLRDDESLASSPAFPTCTVPTKSAKAKSRMESPSSSADKKGTPEKGSIASAKKRLSFPNSPAVSRKHSGPLKVNSLASNKDVASVTDKKFTNGGR